MQYTAPELYAITKVQPRAPLNNSLRAHFFSLGLHSSCRMRGCRAGIKFRKNRARSTRFLTEAVVFNGIPVIHSFRAPVCKSFETRPRFLSKVTCVDLLGSIKFGLLNTCSLGNKSELIHDTISSENYDIFACVETWHESNSSPSLVASCPHGYLYVEKGRPVDVDPRHHGGICVFYKSDFKVSIRLTKTFETFESLSLIFSASSSGSELKFILATVYRPGSVAPSLSFHDDIDAFFSILSVSSLPLIIVGDINIHLNKLNNKDTIALLESLDRHELAQNVREATHKAGNTLDAVITSENAAVCNLSVAPPLISDHGLITFDLASSFKSKSHKFVLKRLWSRIDRTSLQSDLSSLDFLSSFCYDPLSHSTEVVEQLFESYDGLLSDLADKYAPFCNLRVRCFSNAKWFDGECRAAKRHLRLLERRFRKTNDTHAFEVWKNGFKELRRLFVKKRSDYFDTCFRTVNSASSRWKILSSMLKPTAPQPEQSPNAFSAFFQSKVGDLRLFSANADPPTLQFKEVSGLALFENLSQVDVLNLLKNSNSKSCSLDIFPTWLVLDLLPVFLPILTALVNASLQSGVFPTCHKVAIISPILKKPGADPSILGNYRPISNVSFLSKLIERAVFFQLNKYLLAANLLPIFQSGFKAGNSTETALLRVYNDIVRASDIGQLTLLVLLDFSSAFDTVDHGILFSILERTFGLAGCVLNWIKSFLANRVQHISIDGRLSNRFSFDCGVPQGSVLGPLLYILYTADIFDVVKKHGLLVHCYADDTQIYMHVPRYEVTETLSKFERCLDDILLWSKCRRLKLNGAKTELIVFDRRGLLDRSALSISLDGVSVIPVDYVKVLGVYISQDISMTKNVTSIAKACFYHLRRIRQIRRHIDVQATKTLVVAFVMSRLDYCNSLLVGLPVSVIKPLVSVIHAAVRIVCGLRMFDHVSASLSEMHWLPINSRIKYKICVLMHQLVRGTGPVYLQQLISERSYGGRTMRSSSQHVYQIPKTYLKFGERAFSVSAPMVWNSIPLEIREINEMSLFKKHLKTFLF